MKKIECILLNSIQKFKRMKWESFCIETKRQKLRKGQGGRQGEERREGGKEGVKDIPL